MNVNIKHLNEIATSESIEDIEMALDLELNGELYKASTIIAMKVKRALRMAKMSQISLAENLGIDPATVSRCLNGKSNMELSTIVKLEKALGIRIIDRDITPNKRPVVIKIVYSDSHNFDFKMPGYNNNVNSVLNETKLNIGAKTCLSDPYTYFSKI